VYERSDTGRVRPLYEFKPTDLDVETPTSLSSLPIGTFRRSPPTKQLSSMEFVSMTNQWLLQFLQFLRDRGICNVAVAALVTGTIRTAWEMSRGSDRQSLDSVVSSILHEVCHSIVPATGSSSFFLSQASEGLFEHDALQAVVDAESGSVPARLLLGIGIGRGSTQIPYRTQEQQVCVATLPDQGMQNPELASDMLRTGVAAWRGPSGRSLLEDFAANVRRTIDNREVPVVALKSGALLAYTDTPRVQEGLREMCVQMVAARGNGRSIARTPTGAIMWDLQLRDGTLDEVSQQRMITALWKYAPDRILV
jgi:hypothetical protein